MSKVIDLTGKPQSEWYTNPNLLDNWYFADSIDQRYGYVVPPDTPYFSDTGLSAQEGTASTYTTAVYGDGVYGTVTVGGATYYVDWTAALRGYSNYGDGDRSIQSIDRWRTHSNLPAVLIQEDGLLMVRPASTGWILQILPQAPEYFVNKTVTLSVLLGDGTLCHTTAKFESADPVVLDTKFDRVTLRWQIAYSGLVQFVLYALNLGDVKVVAAKLELGSVQTLAHQNAEGNWVLNDSIFNPGVELAKCQRYLQLYSTEGQRPTLAVDCRPVMRIDPTPTTIQINGTTYYANSAEL